MLKELFDLVLLPRINAEVFEILNRHLNNEQIALLILMQVNPYMVLTQQQEALLRGVNPKTLRGMKQRGEIAQKVNPDFSLNSPVYAGKVPDSAHPGGASGSTM